MNLDPLHELTQTAQIGPLVCAFTLDARPTPKGRPRFSRGRTYTDEKTVAFEQHVTVVARQAMKGKEPTSQLARVIVLFEQADRRRSDLDNCCKAVLDGIAIKGGGPVLVNDSQVVEIRARLDRGAPRDRITVLVEEIPA